MIQTYMLVKTKVRDIRTFAPKRYTAGLCIVTKVILWCILNHCIADSIDLSNDSAYCGIIKSEYFEFTVFQNIENKNYLFDLMKNGIPVNLRNLSIKQSCINL